MKDLYANMSFQEQYSRFLSHAKLYNTRQMQIIAKWVKMQFLECKFVKIRKNTHKEYVQLANKLVKYNYATINEFGYLVLRTSILHLSYYTLFD